MIKLFYLVFVSTFCLSVTVRAEVGELARSMLTNGKFDTRKLWTHFETAKNQGIQPAEFALEIIWQAKTQSFEFSDQVTNTILDTYVHNQVYQEMIRFISHFIELTAKDDLSSELKQKLEKYLREAAETMNRANALPEFIRPRNKNTSTEYRTLSLAVAQAEFLLNKGESPIRSLRLKTKIAGYKAIIGCFNILDKICGN